MIFIRVLSFLLFALVATLIFPVIVWTIAFDQNVKKNRKVR